MAVTAERLRLTLSEKEATVEKLDGLKTEISALKEEVR
jgi:hypothetical protein